MINLELFCCAGGMASGFRRAGVHFDVAVDFTPDHCDSYERNIGHRPHQVDVRGLLAVVRRIRRGERVVDGPVARLARRLLCEPIDLLVADPPCTPWSRAGKRMGVDDSRDMLGVTCSLIAILGPRRYLIGNVPGLDDATNLHVVQRYIGALARHGYCVRDFARLDAADYGVPQHRIRPWWFGHRDGPCVQWTAPTHGNPLDLATLPLPGITPLRPWVTCREALGHLEGDELGRAVKMRRRAQNGHQLGSVPERPARVVGTSNLSDGNVITVTTKHPALSPDAPATTVTGGGDGHGARPIVLSRHEVPVHTSELDAPARAITTQCRAPGHASTITLNARHAPADADAPAPTLGAKYRGQGAQVLIYDPQHPPSYGDEPSMTVRAGCGAGATRAIQFDGRDEDFAVMSLPDAIALSERAAAILQGFPDDGSWTFCGKTKKARWSQIGQAMPPALAEAVARSVVRQDEAARKLPDNARSSR